MKRKLILAVSLVLFGSALFAAPWAAHNGRRSMKTLTVVGNYKTPRMMAELILSLTRQPYLLVANDGRYFMVLSGNVVQEIPAAKLDVYINNTGVRRLVILGDENFVSAETEKKLRTINMRRTPIIRIYGEDWPRIAEELDDLLNIGNLSREFNRNSRDLLLRDRPLRSREQENVTNASAPAAAEAAPLPEENATAPVAEK